MTGGAAASAALDTHTRGRVAAAAASAPTKIAAAVNARESYGSKTGLPAAVASSSSVRINASRMCV